MFTVVFMVSDGHVCDRQWQSCQFQQSPREVFTRSLWHEKGAKYDLNLAQLITKSEKNLNEIKTNER